MLHLCTSSIVRCSSLFLAVAASSTLVADTDVSGPILANTTWTQANSPYVVTGSILIGGGSTLTIEPGVVIRVNADLGIQVGSPEGFGHGTLVAQGTPSQPIRFTSNAAPETQAPGDWIHVFFSDLAVDATFVDDKYESGSILQHVIVEYAGAGSPSTGSVTVNSASPYLDSVEVRSSARSGLRIDAGTAPSLRITNCELWSCSVTEQHGGALYINGGEGHLISGNDIYDNVVNLSVGGVYSGGGVYLQNATNTAFTGNKIENNDAFANGGGFYATGCVNLLFRDNLVLENSANTYGGAFMEGSAIDCVDNLITGNSASSWAGMYVWGNNALVTGNTIINNIASGQGGGGGLLGSSLQVGLNQWSGNTAGLIGGLDINSDNVLFVDNIISDNQAINANGDVGGIEIDGDNGTYTGNVITGNSAGRDGGGMVVDGDSGHTFVGNLIDGNIAGARGGGVFLDALNTTWSDNVITNNAAATQGGAIHNNQEGNTFAGDVDANVFNTITGNAAPLGPAIFHNVASGAGGNLPATFVCWGTSDQSVVQTIVHDFFDNAALGIVFTFPLVEECGAPACPADLTGDGSVDGADLGIVLGAWATSNPAADLNDDGIVDGADLGLLLGSWGSCG